MESITELARRGKEAVIVFDDLSRGTPVRPIAEIVLEELAAGGIAKDHIRFLCAIGTHGALTRADFVKKLGEEIVENYPVFNHNPFMPGVQVGVDKEGYPVAINAEYMDCDVRIGIGSVSPHPMNGYGGGGKILFPGLAALQTTCQNHARREFTWPGNKDTCGFRSDIESMAAMTGSLFKIDVVINSHMDILAVTAGEARKEYYEAVQISEKANRMKPGKEKDIVIANANAKYNEPLVALGLAETVLKPGGDIVLVNHCPQGHVVHYTFSPFGLAHGGTLWQPPEQNPPMKCGRVIYYTPYPDVTTKLNFREPDKVVFAKTWEEVLKLLEEHGSGTTVSVLSDASIGYFPH
jgi:nickel-dependent lactate racemase